MASLIEKLTSLGSPTKIFKYGTAGFRDRNDVLDPVLFRVGLIACARSVQVKQAIGIMITASHNAEEDNGVKIVDFNGGMLASSWEQIAEKMINVPMHQFKMEFESLLAEFHLNDLSSAVVIIAMDTRPHSDRLKLITAESIQMVNAKLCDIGIATTPQLHYAVYQYNNGTPSDRLISNYYTDLCNGYTDLVSSGANSPVDMFDITVDCANGVGSVSIDQFTPRLSHLLTIDTRNAAYSGKVNEGCGAEHCQKLQVPPTQMKHASGHTTVLPNKLLCSLDGDADRIVFHMYHEKEGGSKWVLLDGDKIACIMAQFLMRELSEAGIFDPSGNLENGFTLGVVQTAYANGASTAFLRARGIPVAFAKTGVKYCHKMAHDLFDCGVYFEANGHGTVLFSDRLIKHIQLTYANLAPRDGRKYVAYHRLQVL